MAELQLAQRFSLDPTRLPFLVLFSLHALLVYLLVTLSASLPWTKNMDPRTLRRQYGEMRGLLRSQSGVDGSDAV